MKVQVSGKQLDVGAALTEHVEDRLLKSVSKYFDRAIAANVVFSKESHLNRADIVVNEGTGAGPVIKGRGKANDIYAAFDDAADRIEKQLRRYKRRIKDHHKDKVDSDTLSDGVKYILDGGDCDSEEAADNPLIIAEKPQLVEKISVSDAVMRMDLADLPALTFINEKTSTVSVIYRRKDGNISWVDTKIAA
jgi:ribosomal subunit interface protein